MKGTAVKQEVPLRKVVAMLRAMIEQVKISGRVSFIYRGNELEVWKHDGGSPLSAEAREMLERAGKSSEPTAEPAQNADQDLGVIACDQSTDLTEEDKQDWEMD